MWALQEVPDDQEKDGSVRSCSHVMRRLCLPLGLCLCNLPLHLTEPIPILLDSLHLANPLEPSDYRIPEFGNPRVGLCPDAVELARGDGGVNPAPGAEDLALSGVDGALFGGQLALCAVDQEDVTPDPDGKEVVSQVGVGQRGRGRVLDE